MKRIAITATWLAAAVALAGAVGPAARYLEELAIGGGYNDPADGGADFDKTGAITTNGAITADGVLRLGGGTGESRADIDGGAGANRMLRFLSNGSVRWRLIGGTTAAESGGNAGSDLLLQSFSDGGAFIDNPIAIVRAGSGTVSVGGSTGRPTVFSGDATVQGGDIEAGTNGGTRGQITAWHGAGGGAAGCLRLASEDGTVWYFFVDNAGDFRIHDALPTSDTDGTVVGTQF